jgi:hypothetical protein
VAVESHRAEAEIGGLFPFAVAFAAVCVEAAGCRGGRQNRQSAGRGYGSLRCPSAVFPAIRLHAFIDAVVVDKD